MTGFGEFLGYTFRLISGYFVDRTGKEWPVTILGYALLLSVPLLGFSTTWKVAAIFVLCERLGKAIRSPGKSSMLSHATKHVGTGFGFGILEAIDQLGALVGPLIFTFALTLTGTYKAGFKFMLIPALLTIAFVIYARITVPNPKELEDEIKSQTKVEIKDNKAVYTKKFINYSLFIFFSIVGFVNFPILSYHFLNKKLY
ncbi:MFS transporter [Caloramator sp. mosi_1]|uniref:MFS transporter n=1 Tax=Caloramator sp. mosi_1 TaxID=3023090 RepID=UPI00235EBA7B|nr:MFS transporter [Caloramator sp. mosi_1]WDC85647.1 MFS transporter [Caloramator sp. mosi_1]